jgi:hypothetical protein
MSIQVVQSKIKIPGVRNERFKTRDGETFLELEEAVEHENKLNTVDRPKPTYDYVTSVQQAINMAVAENRVVRFLSEKENSELRKGIEDLKGCRFIKPDRESHDIAVIPPSVKNFDFDKVD